jgi:hypothetical protein
MLGAVSFDLPGARVFVSNEAELLHGRKRVNLQ